MKRFTITLLCCMAVSLSCSAQKTFTIEQGQNFSHAIPFNELYMYPSFRQGAVYYKNKSTAGGAINYSYLTQELLFIGPAGDTLSVEAPEEIDSVTIDKDVLYFYKGLVKLDTITGEARLASSHIFSPADKKVVGFNGISTSSTSNMTYVQYKINPGTTMVADEQTVLLKNKVFYIGDRMNHFLPVTKKNLHKFYSKKEKALSTYLEQNAVNYSNRTDLVKLLAFMEQQ